MNHGPEQLNQPSLWAKLLAAANITVQRTGGKFVLTDCPLCRRQDALRIWMLAHYPAGWGWCRECDAYGDIVQLAAAVWKLDATTALQELGRIRAGLGGGAGWAETAYAYEQTQQARQHVLTGLQELRRALPTDTQSAFATPMLHTVIPPEQLADMEAPLVATGEALNDLLYSRLSRRVRVQAAGKYLVIPSCDLPRRPICVSVYSADWSPVSQLPLGPVRSAKKAEAGVIGLSQALRAGIAGTGGCVAVLRPATAITAQLRHARHSGQLLPVVGIVTGRTAETQRAYDWLASPAQLVLWDEHTTVETLRLAMLADASASSYVTSDDPWPLSTVEKAGEQLHKIRRHAQRWHLALARALSKLPADQLAVVAKTFQFNDAQWRQLQRSADTDSLQKLTLARTHHVNPAVVLNDGTAATVNSTGLWSHSKHICPTWLKITGLTLSADSHDCLGLDGLLHFHSLRQPFHWAGTATRLAKTQLADWLRKQQLPADQAILISQPTDRRVQTLQDLVKLALQLDDPPTYDGYSRIGWSVQKGQFQFPAYVLGASGLADTCQRYVGPRAAPCQHFCRPAPLLPHTLSRLSAKTAKAQQMWTILALVLQQALSRIYSQQPQPAGLAGCAADAAVTVAAHFGASPERRWQHNWPVLRQLQKYNRQPVPRGGALLYGAPLWQAAAACSGLPVLWCRGWRAAADDDHLRAVVPAFLEWFIRSQQDPGILNMESMYGLLHGWWQNLQQPRSVIDRSWQQWAAQQQHHAVDLFGLLLHTRSLAMDDATLFSDSPLAVPRRGDVYELTADTLYLAIKTATDISVDAELLLQRLATEGVGCRQGDKLTIGIVGLRQFYVSWIKERLPLQ